MDQSQQSCFCPNCGAAIPGGSAFCPNCGAKAAAPAFNQNPYQQQPQNPYQRQTQQFNQYQNQAQQNQAQYQQQYQQYRQQYAQPSAPQYQGQSQYFSQQPGAYPAARLKTNRSLLAYILLGMITCGIYSIVVMSEISTSINTIASRYDGKKTMHYCLMAFILAGLTLGIYPLVWYHGLSDRIGNELKRRGVNYSFGAGTFWGWCILGSLLFGIGPIVYQYKLLKAMNLLSEQYNACGC